MWAALILIFKVAVFIGGAIYLGMFLAIGIQIAIFAVISIFSEHSAAYWLERHKSGGEYVDRIRGRVMAVSALLGITIIGLFLFVGLFTDHAMDPKGVFEFLANLL